MGLSARVTPGLHSREGLGASGRLAFWPAEGGSEELSGVLGRNYQLGFERGDASVQRQEQRDQLRLVEFAKRNGGHPEFESARCGRINPARPSQDVAQNARWG